MNLCTNFHYYPQRLDLSLSLSLSLSRGGTLISLPKQQHFCLPCVKLAQRGMRNKSQTRPTNASTLSHNISEKRHGTDRSRSDGRNRWTAGSITNHQYRSLREIKKTKTHTYKVGGPAGYTVQIEQRQYTHNMQTPNLPEIN